MSSVLIVALVVGGIVGIAWKATSMLKRRSDPLRGMARWKISEIDRDEQIVKVVGTVKLVGAPLHSPIAGAPCAAWQVVVEKWVDGESEEGGGGRWDWVATECKGGEFSISDASGRASIGVTEHSRFELQRETQQSGERPPAIEELLNRHTFDRSRPLRCRESVVEDGATVVVSGVAHFEPDPDAGYRAPARRLVIRGTWKAQLQVTDDLDRG